MGCMSHPNLVSLTEACMWGDYLWMAMELMTCSVFGLLYNMSVGLPESYAVRVAHEVSFGEAHFICSTRSSTALTNIATSSSS